MATTREVMVVGAGAADAAALAAALDRLGPTHVTPASGLEQALARVRGAPPLDLVLVVPSADVGEPLPFLAAVHDLRRELVVAVAAPLDADAERDRWLAAGADGHVVLPGHHGLAGVLARAERQTEHQRQDAARQGRQRLAIEALGRLARSTAFRGDNLPRALAEVTEAGVRGLEATRVGVWLANDTRSHLRLVDAFDARDQAHSSGLELAFASRPRYVAALTRETFLVTRDVLADERFAELRDDYFRPQGVSATLDVAVRQRGELVGALCVEQLGTHRVWSNEDQMLAGALADVVALALESAERHRAESALYESERRFRDLFLYSSDNIVLNRVALDGSIYCEDINPATEKATGVPRDVAVGRTVHEVLPKETADRLLERYRQCVQARAPISYEHWLAVPSGRRYYSTAIVPLFDEQGRVHRLASMARDVTSLREAELLQRRLETREVEAQKHESLARLAGHIAHDVNNLLALIEAHATAARTGATSVAEATTAVLEATRRGRELTRQVLTFGRQEPLEQKPVELAPLVGQALTLLGPVTSGLTLRQTLSRQGTTVRGDAGALHQAVTNLVTNAAQAMPQGGTLSVSLEPVTVDWALAANTPPLTTGRWVRLSVRDTGVGMSDETRRRIFEPFFTTRPDGTGLGLSVVQSAVSALGGCITVDSTPGEGSRFDLWLPALEVKQATPSRGRHLLLVDDHPGMARVSARLLETLGYRTSVFEDPVKALEAFQAAPDTFDAVLTDLSMPQLSGEDFTKAVHAVRPALPVIFTTGRVGAMGEEELARVGAVAVLLKPWRVEEAVATLEKVLTPPAAR